ncbi:protein translocase subunit SecF [Patescibacteria group bacterium]
MKYKRVYLIFSGAVLVPGIISLILFGLNLSIDFTGGSVFVYDVAQVESQSNVEGNIRDAFSQKEVGVSEYVASEGLVEVRTHPIESFQNDEINEILAGDEGLVDINQKSFETVGPSVGKEATLNAFKALGIASLGIMLYIAYAFRNIPKPYSSLRFGASAIVAMLHDAILLVGIFSILGKISGVEVDSLFITAVLTVIGFSIHDSIVVFDRIRENLKKLPTSWDFEQVVNFSIVETLNRSFATSLTVLITLLSLFILGGQSIKYFVLALLIGILSGTYSSIFTASPILVMWEDKILEGRKKE